MNGQKQYNTPKFQQLELKFVDDIGEFTPEMAEKLKNLPLPDHPMIMTRLHYHDFRWGVGDKFDRIREQIKKVADKYLQEHPE